MSMLNKIICSFLLDVGWQSQNKALRKASFTPVTIYIWACYRSICQPDSKTWFSQDRILLEPQVSLERQSV